jgi:hypothetical protein
MGAADMHTSAPAASIGPDTPLGMRLRAHRVQVRADGPDGVILQNVPANRRYFNKAGTNLMVKRGHEGLPAVVAVDHDLEYRGADPVLVRAFTGGTIRQGWRILFVEATAPPLATVVEDALRAVGFDGAEPAWNPSSGPHPRENEGAVGGVIRRCGRPVEPLLEQADARARGDVERAAAGLVGLCPRLPVFVGPPGVGKSYRLRGLAWRLPAVLPGVRLVGVDLGPLFLGTLMDPERENLVGAVLEEACSDAHVVVALERIELVALETRHGTAALASAMERGARVVGTTAGPSLTMFDDSPIERYMQAIVVALCSVDEACALVRESLPRLEAHHGVRVAEELVRPMVDRVATRAGHLPSAALSLADLACAHARLDGRDAVGIAQIYAAACALRGGAAAG